MKNLILISAILLVSFQFLAQPFAKKDTLRFTSDSSYSRAITRWNGNLVFGTSKTGVIAYSEKRKTTQLILPPIKHGEYRDVIGTKKGLFAIVSGDNGKLFWVTDEKSLLVYAQDSAFFDDIAWKNNKLTLLGDPTNNRFLLREIFFDKDSSTRIEHISSQKDEACYAASGTTGQFLSTGDYVFISGGTSSARFHRFSWGDTSSYFAQDLPMIQGEGCGPFSLHFHDFRHGIAVGGNYTSPKDTTGNCAITSDGGKTWTKATIPPRGYRSCVTGVRQRIFACGTTGIDYSIDDGKTWRKFDDGNFCALRLEGNYLYATTNKGYCIRYKTRLKRGFYAGGVQLKKKI